MLLLFATTYGTEWTCLAKNPDGIAVHICPKYSACFWDTAVVVMQSEKQIVLVKKDGRTVIERANLNTLEISDGR